MCIEKDTLFKILELGVSISIPIVIVILGVKLARKIEDSKNESIKQYYWQNKWTEFFFERFKEYVNTFSELISKVEFLKHTKQESELGVKLPKEIDELMIKVHYIGVSLKIQASSLYGEKDEITISIENVYLMLAKYVNKNEGDLVQVFEELRKLNVLAGEIFDRTLKNKTI